MSIFNPDYKDFILALNKNEVEYILVGGYAVIMHGYSRSTGDLDIWVNQTESNFLKLKKAFAEFGLPVNAITEVNFFSPDLDVFSFGKPPYAIEIMTAVKGLSFDEANSLSAMKSSGDIEVRVINLQQLIKAKKASGRYKDLNDIENLENL